MYAENEAKIAKNVPQDDFLYIKSFALHQNPPPALCRGGIQNWGVVANV
jgi:hypothetical protein